MALNAHSYPLCRIFDLRPDTHVRDWLPESGAEVLSITDRAELRAKEKFDHQIARFRGDLRTFVSRRVPEGDVDDIVQETLMAAWNGRASFDNRSQPKTWLFSIALNKCRDFYRSSKAGRDSSLEDAPLHQVQGIDKSIGRTEVQESIQGLLDSLPRSQREVLCLYYFSGLNLKEVARTLSRNLNTVKYQFYRAHAELEHKLEQLGVRIGDLVTPDSFSGGKR